MSRRDRALVGNAGDPAQVAEGTRREKELRERELKDLRAILDMPEGRRFVWRLLEHCKVFQSIWHPSALIHFNEGARNVGLFVLNDIEEANPDALLVMRREARNEK